MTHRRLNGQTALVTGASSGLGLQFARQLAALGADLVLVARREEALRALAVDLEHAHGIVARVLPADLAAPGAVQALFERTADTPVDILVNNAGFGLFGDFLELPWADQERMLRLDMLVLTELTQRFGAHMARRGRGRVLQVASIAAFQPTPTYAAYAAAKAYVLSLGVALGREWRSKGVTCTVLSPGVTATAFFEVSGQEPVWFHRLTMMPADRVAAIGLAAMLKGRASVVPGLGNRLSAFAMRFIPRAWSAAVAEALMR